MIPEIHVIPNNDPPGHKENQDCLCEPRVEYIDKETGLPFPGGCVVIHNSWDGRELKESS